jgi:hypothetical protein
MSKKYLIAGVLLVAGLQTGLAQAADQAAYKAACNAAEEARKMSAELKYEWNTLQPLIDKANEAAKAGDFAKAVSLCNEAKLQGEAAVFQARQQADEWRSAVVK